MSELNDITGVGGTTESRLNDVGIETVDDLANADPADLGEISEGKAGRIIRRAEQQMVTSKTAVDLLDEYRDQEYISTGIDALDDLLDGGWEPETVSMLYGKSGTGKTQVLFSTMADAASEGSVVYLMTEIQSKSIADRLESLAGAVDDLGNIFVYQAHDIDEQYDAYEAIDQDMDDIDLLVVDSFQAQFRMTERFDGRENYGERSKEMGKHLRKLGEMSRVYQAPVVLTGQVYESPEMFSSHEDLYGGQKMEHFVSYFLRMRHSDGNLREAALENHAGIEEGDVQIRIEDTEIVGADK